MTVSQLQGVWKGPAAAMDMFSAFQTAAATLTRYTNAYNIPLIIATNYFNQIESARFWSRTPVENLLAYLKLGTMNMELAGRALNGSLQAMDQFLAMELLARLPALAAGKPEAVADFAQRMQHLAERVAYAYPAAIDNVGNEFGFHFERQPASSRVHETDRYILYQVLPSDPKVQPRENGKPILIIPPFVLGANILAFLPQENRSYAHAYANQGFPTYVRVLKSIQSNEAVQHLTPEDDVKDTRQFCEIIHARHGLPLTLNGYCQGGYTALCNLLSGELDGLVDALITCVAPMDGYRSRGLSKFLQGLPKVFNDLAYGTKTLPNGNKVADGTLMGWIYKLKSIETETPLLAMWRDMILVSKSNGNGGKINKTATALNYWLANERNDLPLAITRMSFDSYNAAIGKDGTLPVKLFGRALNLKRIQEKNIPWLICYGKQDDLVEPETALAPLDFVEAEATGFPKGHVAIATSWSHPDSSYALHQRYSEEGTRGPVRFQLDLQEAIDQAYKKTQVKAREEVTGEQLKTQAGVTDKMEETPPMPKTAPKEANASEEAEAKTEVVTGKVEEPPSVPIAPPKEAKAPDAAEAKTVEAKAAAKPATKPAKKTRSKTTKAKKTTRPKGDGVQTAGRKRASSKMTQSRKKRKLDEPKK